MQWFKFYGQDYFSDPKIMALSVEEKLCFIALLSMANAENKEGLISNVNPGSVLGLIGADPESPMWMSAINFIEKFEALQLITDVTFSDVTKCYTVTVTNFSKRNERVTPEALRMRRYREKQSQNKTNKDHNKDVTPPLHQRNSYVTVTVDKNRIEKNRTDNIYNIGASPNFKKLEESKQALADKLSVRNGISQAWQEKAFRYAKYLHIKLDDQTLKGRWLHFFKFNQNSVVDSAVSSIKDAPTFLTIDKPEEKVKYFFSVVYGRIKPS